MAKKTNTNRRDFLKLTAAGAAGIALSSQIGTVFAKQTGAVKSPLNKWPGRVVVNFNKAAVTASSNPVAVPDVIKTMVDDSIKRLTGQSDIGLAWSDIFPETISATSKIAIKVNTLNAGNVAPHFASVQAMVAGLKAMTVGGAAFPAANITIYDMNNGTGENRLSTAGYKAENFPGISIVTDTAIDGGDGALSNRKYASTLKAADYLINVFGARGHDIPPDGSKFSMGFKSHYGTYADPDPGLHQDVPEKLRAINTSGPVYNKQVLSVCVGIFGTNEGKGPQGAADVFSTYSKKIDASSTCLCPATVVMSTDPISAEVQSIKILRLNKAASFATADLPGYLKSSAGIDVAGLTPTHNLGTIDETQMDIRRIMNGQIIAVKDPTARLAMGGIMVSAHQVQGHSTFIDFAVPSDHLGKQAKIEIFDAKGSLARTFSQKVMGIRNNVSWDEKDSKGNMVAKGMYVVRLSSGTVQEASQFSIMR